MKKNEKEKKEKKSARGFQILVVSDFWVLVCDLDAISIGGMEFCYLEFCLNFMFWSCYPVPVDPSCDCIRVFMLG